MKGRERSERESKGASEHAWKGAREPGSHSVRKQKCDRVRVREGEIKRLIK